MVSEEEEEEAAIAFSNQTQTGDKATLTVGAFNTDYNFRQSFCDRYNSLYNETSYILSKKNNSVDGDEHFDDFGVKDASNPSSSSAASPSSSEGEAEAEEEAITIANVLSGTNINLIIADDGVHLNYNEERGGRIDTTVPGLHAGILDSIAAKSNFTWRDSFGIFYYDEITDRNESFTTFLD